MHLQNHIYSVCIHLLGTAWDLKRWSRANYQADVDSARRTAKTKTVLAIGGVWEKELGKGTVTKGLASFTLRSYSELRSPRNSPDAVPHLSFASSNLHSTGKTWKLQSIFHLISCQLKSQDLPKPKLSQRQLGNPSLWGSKPEAIQKVIFLKRQN